MPQPTRPAPTPAARAIGALIALPLAYFAWSTFVDVGSKHELHRIESQAAESYVARYGIVARNGTAQDRCSEARLVAEAFLDAKDEAKYAVWKATAEKDCAEAGRSQ